MASLAPAAPSLGLALVALTGLLLGRLARHQAQRQRALRPVPVRVSPSSSRSRRSF